MTDLHPNGPRNFATLMRDAVPLPRDVIERAMSLDTGHPALTELRLALGVDLDLTRANAAGLQAWPTGRTPDDAELARVLDAMYGAVTSPRQVRVVVTETGVELSTPREPIVVRGEAMAMWLFLENQTGTQADATRAGQRVIADPHRSGSVLLALTGVQQDVSSLQLNMDVAGRAQRIDVAVECHPTGTLRVSIAEDATGAPTAARVYLRDDLGPVWPDGAIFRRDFHGNVFFHADGAFEARVCGSAHLRVVRGIEYEPAVQEIAVAAGTTVETAVRCRRWSHMAAEGWYSGDVHVHLHYGGEYLLSPADAALVQRAEDVHFMNMMVANQGSGWVHDADNFTGSDHELSDSGHILRWGEEYRNNFYGHMCMFGIDELVPPIHSGFPNSDHAHDVPSNAEAAAHCHAVGGALSYAHPMFARSDLDRVFAPEHRLSVEAKELPVDAALGHIDAVDVLAYPANARETCTLWYRLLNCGLHLAATAGTDTFMNFCDQRMFSNPPAGDRVFASLDGAFMTNAFTTKSWCDAVRAGRTFVTNAPMLTLDVGGRRVGDEIGAEAGASLRVECSAKSAVPIDQIELLVNGEAVASARAGVGGREASLSHTLRVDESCWVALRASGGVHELVLHPEGAFAHTSPVYVTVAGAPVARAGDAAYFVEWIDRLIAMTEDRARFPSAAERDRVIATFRSGQAFFRRIAGAR
jgi:hypothetical protein